jgi:hypothetical protein
MNKSNVSAAFTAFNIYNYNLLSPHIGKAKGYLVLAGGASIFAIAKITVTGETIPFETAWIVGSLTARFGINAKQWEQESRRYLRENVWDKRQPANWVKFDKHIRLAGESILCAPMLYWGIVDTVETIETPPIFRSSPMDGALSLAILLGATSYLAVTWKNEIKKSGGLRKFLNPPRPQNG